MVGHRVSGDSVSPEMPGTAVNGLFMETPFHPYRDFVGTCVYVTPTN